MAHGGVLLPALHLLKRAQEWVLVIQPDHEAQRDLVAVQVVGEAAAKVLSVIGQPAGVDDAAS